MDLRVQPPAKILLVEPPFYRLFGYERWHYPVTLVILGTYLKSMGHDVKILDMDRPTSKCRSLTRSEARNNYHQYKDALRDESEDIWLEVLNVIDDYKPDAVGMTSISPKIDSANLIARKIKEYHGHSVKVFLGGPHVDGMLRHYKNYNFGEYYDSVILAEPDEKKNVFNRKPEKELLLDFQSYQPKNFSSLLTSIGCANSCTFCCHSYDRVFSYRDTENLDSELKELSEWYPDKPDIYIMDDCSFTNARHFETVTTLLERYGFSFTCGARIMALSQEKLHSFVKRGGKRLYLGIESGSQRVLDKINKRLLIDQIRERTRWVRDMGLPWSAFAVVGFPFETIDDLRLTEELLFEIQPTFASLNRFTPYPGTQIYQDYFVNSDIPFYDLFQLNPSSCVKLSDEMEEGINHIFEVINEYNKQHVLGTS